MTTILITLGSNINKEQNLSQAIEVLRHHPDFQCLAVSPIYETAPVATLQAQANYYNAAMMLQTELKPTALRQTLRALEAAQGRTRSADKSAARTLDLDLAFYGQETLVVDNHRIPEPDIIRFAYLALPLADIAPEWRHPDNHLTLRQIAQDLAPTEMEIRKL